MRLSTLKYWILLIVLVAVTVICCPSLAPNNCETCSHKMVSYDCHHKICELCGELSELSYAQHKYQYTTDASCRKTATCTLCGYTQTAGFDHTFQTIRHTDCTVSQQCTRCRIMTDPKPSHTYGETKCGEFARCIFCDATQRLAKPHQNCDFLLFSVCRECGEFHLYTDSPFLYVFAIFVLLFILLAVLVIRKRQNFGKIFISLRPCLHDPCNKPEFQEKTFLCFHDKIQ